jgi:hypothetical protein
MMSLQETGFADQASQLTTDVVSTQRPLLRTFARTPKSALQGRASRRNHDELPAASRS